MTAGHGWGRAVVLFAAAVIVAPVSLPAAEPQVSVADRETAAAWASQVDGELARKDPGEAARRLLRAVRWDPSRWEDYRSAIELLELVDPEAAVRHASAEAQSRSRFTREDAALLSRLAKAALGADEKETWQDAADLARAAAEQVAKQGPAHADQAAQLWASAGASYSSLGSFRAASDAFEPLQRAAVAEEDDQLKRSYRWDIIAGCHLDASRPDRAAVAIELLRDGEGDSARALVLQSRLALALDEPLAAIDHANQAIDKLEEAADGSAADAYTALIDAMRMVNQADRAAARLAKESAKEPENLPLALAAIEAKLQADQLEACWDECGALIDWLATRIAPAESLLGEDSSAAPALLDAFADAAAMRLRLAVRTGRGREAVEASVAWAKRLGNLFPLWEEYESAVGDNAFRTDAGEWLDAHKADPEAPAADNLVRASIAYLLDRPDDVALSVLAMLDAALRNGAEVEAAANEVAHWADYLVSKGAYGDARTLLRGTIDRLVPSDPSERDIETQALGRLQARLAQAILSEQAVAGEMGGSAVDEALRLISQARGNAPDDGYVAYQAVFASLYTGRAVEAVAVGEEVFSRWPAPDADSQFGSSRFHETSSLFAAALLLRGEEGDADRAGELLESALDWQPRSVTALSYLAWHDSRRPESRERALRLAQTAIARKPDDSHARGFLGVTQLRGGQSDKGMRSLRRALEKADRSMLSPWERAILREELADALRANGRAEEAEVVESAAP